MACAALSSKDLTEQEETYMGYVLRRATEEDAERIRSNYEQSPAPFKNRVSLPGVGSHIVIDDGKGFYLFAAPGDMRSGYSSSAFFFKGKVYAVRVYHWPVAYGRLDPRGIQISWYKDGKGTAQQVERGFSCFEGYSAIPSEDLMEEFQREFSEAFVLFRPDEDAIPFFSDPLIVHRIRSEKGAI
jgi:hypothetical protein